MNNSLLLASLLVGLAAAILFLAFPGLDLAFSALFVDDSGEFHLGQIAAVRQLRAVFNLAFAGFCALAIAGLAAALLLRRRLLGQGWREWLYLLAAAITGPGLVANLLFKDHWGRARPVQVEQFGGDAMFSPVLLFSDQCQRNCSFVSGEASSIYLMFFALAMLLPVWRKPLFLVGIVAGSTAGLVRIAAGGHFLGDVLFAGIFMALVAQLLHRAILGPETGGSGTLGR